jgi:hypothetical protein
MGKLHRIVQQLIEMSDSNELDCSFIGTQSARSGLPAPQRKGVSESINERPT